MSWEWLFDTMGINWQRIEFSAATQKRMARPRESPERWTCLSFRSQLTAAGIFRTRIARVVQWVVTRHNMQLVDS